MKVKKERSYSRLTQEAVTLLGLHIQRARKQRRQTEADLAERAGISRSTLQKIEKGDLNIAIGFAFELAALVGVRLFGFGFPARPSRLSPAYSRKKEPPLFFRTQKVTWPAPIRFRF
jgi:transcriptional regulator with XRE-family HTH domain